MQRHLTTIGLQSLPTSTVSSSQGNRGSTSSTKSVFASTTVSHLLLNHPKTTMIQKQMISMTLKCSLSPSPHCAYPRVAVLPGVEEVLTPPAGVTQGVPRQVTDAVIRRMSRICLRICLRHPQCVQPQQFLK